MTYYKEIESITSFLVVTIEGGDGMVFLTLENGGITTKIQLGKDDARELVRHISNALECT